MIYLFCYIVCSAMTLFEDNPYLGERLVSEPSRLLPLFDQSLCQTQKIILDGLQPHDKTDLVRENTDTTFICGQKNDLVYFYTH